MVVMLNYFKKQKIDLHFQQFLINEMVQGVGFCIEDKNLFILHKQ